MLVLNMANFNFADGWDRVFSPLSDARTRDLKKVTRMIRDKYPRKACYGDHGSTAVTAMYPKEEIG
jgi:hypothetical protein